MALAKFRQIVLVLVVCVTTIFGQNDMYSTEAKHRSVGNRPPPFTYFSSHPPTYGIPPPQRVPSYQATYPVPRPTYAAPPSYPARPSYSPLPYQNAHQTAQRVPAYQIPYPAPKPTATYAAPQKPSYPAPATPRQPATYVTPVAPVYPSPTNPHYSTLNYMGHQAQRAPAPPVYSSPANPNYSNFNYMGHQAHRPPAPPTTTPTPAKVPFTYFASYPSTTPKPYTNSAPSAPVTGPSLLDLPWVKPMYTRSPSAPATKTYTWNVQEAQQAVPVREDSKEDVGVRISSVNTPVSVPATTPVRSQEFEVRAVPQEAIAPVIVPAPTQLPVIIRDESDEDIQIVQEVTRRTPLPASPLIIRDEPQAPRFAPLPMTTQAPLVTVVIRDDSREDIQIAAQRGPSVPLPTTTQVQNVILREDSNENIQIAQQVIPSAPRATQPSSNPIILRDDSNEDVQIAQQVVPSAPRATQPSVNPIIIRDDSNEDIQIVQQIAPSAPRATQPSVNPIIFRDDSNEDIQIVQQVVPTAPRATQPPVNPLIIRGDSNEGIRIVQQVPTSTPSPRTTVAPVTSFVIRDDSVEDIQIVQQVSTFTPSPVTAGAPVNQIIIRDDSVEDVQIVQRIPQVSTATPSPIATQTQRIPVVIRDDSIEDDDRFVQGVRLNLPVSNNNVISSPRPAEATIPSEIPFVRLDNSDEELIFRDVPIGAQAVPNVPVLALAPTTTQAPGTPLLLFGDSQEDFRILQNAPGSTPLRTATRDDSLEVRPDVSNEDIELRLVSLGVTPSNTNLPQPLPTTPAPRRVFLVDSVEDTRRDPGVSISNVQLSGSPLNADVFLVNSNEDVRITQQVPQPSVPLSGPLPGNSTPPRIVLVDSTEDIRFAQQVSLSNVSPSETSPAITTRVILVESAEDVQTQTVNPLLQSANIVLNQESLEVPDRSDEDRVQTTVTISQVTPNLVN